MSKEKLVFYSFYDCHDNRIARSHCAEFIEKNQIGFPSIFLVRDNKWNDYSYKSHFSVFYVKTRENFLDLGRVIIIQSGAPNSKTKLPKKFEFLDKEVFFSRWIKGEQPTIFYKNNSISEGIRKNIFNSLNDIYYFNLTKEDVIRKDPQLEHPYKNSLLRYGNYSPDIFYDKGRSSLKMLEKIEEFEKFVSSLDEEKQKILRNLLYGSVVTTLETYLENAFKHYITTREKYLKMFTQKFETRSKKKNSMEFLEELIQHKNKNVKGYILEEVKKIMNEEITFHKIYLVKKLYEDILNIALPSSIFQFEGAVEKRHHIFHRNGKDKLDNDLNISLEDIKQLIKGVKEFIKETEEIFKEKLND